MRVSPPVRSTWRRLADWPLHAVGFVVVAVFLLGLASEPWRGVRR